MSSSTEGRRVRPIEPSPRSYEEFAQQRFYQEIDTGLLKRAPKVHRAVDFATGTGACIEHLIDLGKLHPGAMVHGIDIDETGLTLARRKFADFLDESPAEITVRFLLGSVEDIPLPDGSQELVTFLNSAHLTNLERSLAEANRLLQRDGILLLNSAYEASHAYPPGSDRHWGLMVVGARRLAKDRGHLNDIPNPINLLLHTADDYIDLCHNCGFADLNIEHHTVDMDLPAILAIFGYEGFVRGALPGVDIDLAIRCLQDSAEHYFQRMKPKGLEAVQRTWMYLEARKSGT